MEGNPMRIRSTRSVPPASPPEPAGSVPLLLLVLTSGAMPLLVLAAKLTGFDTSPLTWYIARASGITLYLLLWASMMLGLGLTAKYLDRRVSRATVFSLHAYVTSLAYGFLAMHVLSLSADRFSAFSLRDLLIPFHSPMREPWTGLGVIAGYLMVGLGLSFSARKLTGYRFWRLAHWLTFPLYLTALAHGLGGGTDAVYWPVFIIYLSTAALLAGVVLVRIGRGRVHKLAMPDGPPPFDRFAQDARPARSHVAAPSYPGLQQAPAAVVGGERGR
jgi:predicted ferric reductase